MKVSPLAPKKFPAMPPVPGVEMLTVQSGMKYQGRTDVLLVRLAKGSTIAGTFTKSLTASAPVEWCREQVAKGEVSAIIVNAGNANAFTGAAGVTSVDAMVSTASETTNCDREKVFVASTGVIGEPLPTDIIDRAIKADAGAFQNNDWQAAAKAIMTTDTFPKGSTKSVSIDGTEVKICGIVKGSGMIAPDMATMLGFVFTDAAIPAPILQKMLTDITNKSFNSITVDSDTSTSDTVLLAATGQAQHKAITSINDAHLSAFKRALKSVCIDLAQQVVKDGEGASKFITIDVSGAKTQKAARRIALSIANSPLVKTAIAGEDANWGRIVMAVGKSGEKADRDALEISIGGHLITEGGKVVEGYDETPVAEHMAEQKISIAVDVGVGRSKARVWTCDLTHGYIEINADYRS